MNWGTTLGASRSFKFGSKDRRQVTRTGISSQGIPTTRPSWLAEKEKAFTQGILVSAYLTPPPLNSSHFFLYLFPLHSSTIVLHYVVITSSYYICTLHLLLLVYYKCLYMSFICGIQVILFVTVPNKTNERLPLGGRISSSTSPTLFLPVTSPSLLRHNQG